MGIELAVVLDVEGAGSRVCGGDVLILLCDEWSCTYVAIYRHSHNAAFPSGSVSHSPGGCPWDVVGAGEGRAALSLAPGACRDVEGSTIVISGITLGGLWVLHGPGTGHDAAETSIGRMQCMATPHSPWWDDCDV